MAQDSVGGDGDAKGVDLSFLWSCRGGLPDRPSSSHLPTFPTQAVPKWQQRCRPAVGMSDLTRLWEEGCSKINGQRPFTAMDLGLGQWVSSSY